MAKINIVQGNDVSLPTADVNIIIDVLRAFTTTFFAFQKGVKEIYLVNETGEGLRLKNQLNNALVAGEIGGYKIEGFDLGNSPSEMSAAELQDKVLILKTSNGVKATLNSLNANAVFVTGWVNVDRLIHFLQSEIKKGKVQHINIVASDPISDDDFACAEYIVSHLLDQQKIDKTNCTIRIKNSKAAEKFLDDSRVEFSAIDLDLALSNQSSNFLMKVENINQQIKIIKHEYFLF
ncbi:MAG: 2-phosphosulfolactate phosphatase [Chitinophagales bacterium]